MFSKLFWEDAGERAGKTFLQALASAALTAGLGGLLGVDWQPVLVQAALMAGLSLASSVMSLPASGNGTASLLRGVTARSGKHEAPTTTTPGV